MSIIWLHIYIFKNTIKHNICTLTICNLLTSGFCLLSYPISKLCWFYFSTSKIFCCCHCIVAFILVFLNSWFPTVRAGNVNINNEKTLVYKYYLTTSMRVPVTLYKKKKKKKKKKKLDEVTWTQIDKYIYRYQVL